MTWVAQSGKRAQGQLLREKVPGVATTLANKPGLLSTGCRGRGGSAELKFYGYKGTQIICFGYMV